MARDFRASNIRVNKIIASGSDAASDGPELLIYPVVSASDSQGGLPTNLTASVGSDVFLFISGSTAVTDMNKSLFGGGVVISGSLDLFGGLGITSDGGGKIILANSDTTIETADALGRIEFYASDEADGGDALLLAAAIEAVATNDFDATNNPTKLSFKTGKSEAATEKMSLDEDGDLYIAGDLRVGGDTIRGSVGGSLELRSDGNVMVHLDDDDDSSNNFRIMDGSDSAIFTVFEATGNCTIAGDLTVEGTTTTIESTVKTIADPLIVLGQGNSGTAQDLGVVMVRGSANNMGIIFDESDDYFKVADIASEDGTTAGDISSVTPTNFMAGKVAIDSEDDYLVMDSANLTIAAGADLVLSASGDAVRIHDSHLSMGQAKKIYLEGSLGSGDGPFIYGSAGAMYLDGDNSVFIHTDTGGYFKLFRDSYQQISATDDGVTINEDGRDNFDFRVQSDELEGAILVDAGTNQVVLGTNETDAAAVGQDTNVYISGSVGSKDSDTKGVAAFQGDVVVSGSLYAESGVNLVPDSKVSWGADSGQEMFIHGDLANTKLTIDGDNSVVITADNSIQIHTQGLSLFSGSLASGVVINQGGGDIDFRVETQDDENAILVDASANTVHIPNLSGSLTHLTDGTSYLIAGSNIQITTGSTGAVTIATDADITSVVAGDGLTGGGTSGDVTLDVGPGTGILVNADTIEIDDSVVATVTGSAFTGTIQALNSESLYVKEYIRCSDDSDSWIRFNGLDAVQIRAGGVTMLQLSEAVEDQFQVNPLGSAVNFKVYGNAAAGPFPEVISVQADMTDGNKIAFGDSPTNASDTFFYVSGSIGARDTEEVGVSVFGGDVLSSGSLFVQHGITGSITKIHDGTDYLIAGAGITISTSSAGAITITNDGTVGDITSVVAGTGLDGGGTSGDVTLNLDYSGADSFVMAATDGTGITVDGGNDKLLIYDDDTTTVKYVNANQVGKDYTAGDGLDVTVGGEFSLDLASSGGLKIDSTELALDLNGLPSAALVSPTNDSLAITVAASSNVSRKIGIQDLLVAITGSNTGLGLTGTGQLIITGSAIASDVVLDPSADFIPFIRNGFGDIKQESFVDLATSMLQSNMGLQASSGKFGVQYDGTNNIVTSAIDGTGITVTPANDLILLYDEVQEECKYVSVSQIQGLPTSGSMAGLKLSGSIPGDTYADNRIVPLQIEIPGAHSAPNGMQIEFSDLKTYANSVDAFTKLQLRSGENKGYFNKYGQARLSSFFNGQADMSAALLVSNEDEGDMIFATAGTGSINLIGLSAGFSPEVSYAHFNNDATTATVSFFDQSGTLPGNDAQFYVSGGINSGKGDYRGAAVFNADLVVSGAQYFEEMATAPVNPPDGSAVLYARDDGLGATKLYVKYGTGPDIQVGSGGSAAGADTEIQFNDGGSAVGAEGNFTFNKATNYMNVPHIEIDEYIKHNGDTDTYIQFPANDAISVFAGNKSLLDYDASDTNPTIEFNLGLDASLDFKVNGSKSDMINVNAGFNTLQFGLDSAMSTDIWTLFSGSVAGRQAGSGVVAFQGDMVVSGSTVSDGARYLKISAGVTGTYAVTSTDYMVNVDVSGGIATVQLPPIADESGRILIVNDQTANAHSNNITIDPDASETINGSSTFTMDQQGQCVTIVCDGAGWVVVSTNQ